MIHTYLRRLATPLLKAGEQIEFCIFSSDQPMAGYAHPYTLTLSTALVREIQDEEELQGILAHNLGHLANKDDDLFQEKNDVVERHTLFGEVAILGAALLGAALLGAALLGADIVGDANNDVTFSAATAERPTIDFEWDGSRRLQTNQDAEHYGFNSYEKLVSFEKQADRNALARLNAANISAGNYTNYHKHIRKQARELSPPQHSVVSLGNRSHTQVASGRISSALANAAVLKHIRNRMSLLAGDYTSFIVSGTSVYLTYLVIDPAKAEGRGLPRVEEALTQATMQQDIVADKALFLALAGNTDQAFEVWTTLAKRVGPAFRSYAARILPAYANNDNHYNTILEIIGPLDQSSDYDAALWHAASQSFMMLGNEKQAKKHAYVAQSLSGQRRAVYLIDQEKGTTHSNLQVLN